MPIKDGDVIKVEYVGKYEDGTIFDSSEINGEPLKFQVGAGQLMKGFEKSVIGLEKGDKISISLQPPEAYGEFDPLLLEKIDRINLPSNGELKIGKKIEIIGPNGISSPGWIRYIGDNSVIVDMNHPLAGKVLNFEIKIIETGLEPDIVQNPFVFGCSDECNHH
jgi:FKBP-type peptidyl-prolyl cis-trans isomerase 2